MSATRWEEGITMLRIARHLGQQRCALAARALSTSPLIPTAASAKAMPRHVSEISGENLFILAQAGNTDAVRERMRREIMAKDGVEYEETTVRLREMSSCAAANHHLHMFPFQLGIVTAGVSGFISIPLVFSYQCASWFNDIFVTADPPEARAATPPAPPAPPTHAPDRPRTHAHTRRRCIVARAAKRAP